MKTIACLLFVLTLFSGCAAAEIHFISPSREEGMPLSPTESVVFSESFVPDTLDRMIVGSDDRITADPCQYPYSAIAYMIVNAECGCSWSGSGFMAGKSLFMTAAHCMVCSTHHKWADQITFYFGYQSRKNYMCKYTGGWDAWVGDMFRNGYRTDNDYAYLMLKEKIGIGTGWFGLRFCGDEALKNGRYTVAGYRDGVLKYDRDRIGTVYDTTFTHYADALPGNSGCPIFDENNDVVGIHVAESRSMNYNIGVKMSDSLMDSMFDNGIL